MLWQAIKDFCLAYGTRLAVVGSFAFLIETTPFVS